MFRKEVGGELEKCAILITGSSIGIGRETALAFAQEGCNIIITYFEDEDEAAKTAIECKELGAEKVLMVHLDVTDDTSIKQAHETIMSEFNEIGILINNAGVVSYKSLVKEDLDAITNVIRTNVEGLIKVTRMFVNDVTKMIINIGSDASKQAYSHLSVYTASKFAVRGFTQALALELNRIKVYCVNPGMTKTRMSQFRGDDPKDVARIILDTAKEKYHKPTGSDIDVWEHMQ